MKTRIFTAIVALAFVSCEKPNKEVESKLQELERKAAEAVERQQELELELAEQKILAERDAIERERALIEQERIEMEARQDAESAAAANELERRQAELMERERKIFETQQELDSREQQITGLETQLSERELELAGREPLDALPAIEKNYVSGPTGDFNNFYEPLGAYGSWFQTRDYGYVYQPSVVRDSSWRPYTRGRWAFTNQGWTWVSSEPFGWACYHYGRWALLRNVGWVWVPGTEWAPAWVTWRESPGHIGWAPLPPETLAWYGHSWDSSVETRFVIDSGWFSFISYRYFGNDIYRHCLPVSQNIVIYRNTTNITHYVVRDRRVFVGGPRYRTVSDRIGRDFPIHRLRLDQSPDFGRGGRLLSSQFSGNELQVIAPRMDAEWNRALRPSRVSRDLGEVVVERSRELPEDVRKQYRDRRTEEDQKAQVVVDQAGGSEPFERERKSRLEKGREEVANNDLSRRPEREPREGVKNDTSRPEQPPVVESPNPRDDTRNRLNDKGSKRAVPETPVIPNPETPTIPTETERPPVSVPLQTELELNESRPEKTGSNRLPRGVVPTPPAIEGNPDINRPVPPSNRPSRPGSNVTPDRPQLPPNGEAELQPEADKNAAREMRRQQEEATRQQQLEAQRAQQQQEQLQKEQRLLRERQEKLTEQLENKERVEKIRDQQEKQEQDRKEQQERLRVQQEQQERMREQQAQQEQARQQQAEAQRLLKEQQDQLRSQQEQQERALKQQEEAQRRAQEQQELRRAQQEQQERMRAQQEQQERMRAQQEQQEQQERMRAQQEQQEHARQQQQEAQRRAEQQQQQEQSERARQQQEQQMRERQPRSQGR